MLLFAILFVALWVVSLGVWWALTHWVRSSDAGRIKNRILGTSPKVQAAGSTKVALFETEQVPKGKILPGLMERYNLTEKTQAMIEQAGLKWNAVKLAQGCIALCVAGYVIAYLALPDNFKPYAIVIAGIAGFAPVWHVMRLRKNRLHAFEEIFPDSLEFISRSMRAGHAFSVSLEMIHREFAEPLATEFRRTFEEHNLGLPLDVALQGLGKRVPLLDVGFFVSAVLLQKRTGGNLAEILDKLAYVIRERFKLRGRIRAVSAHGKMTGIALTCIPIAVAVIMFFANPDYVKFFFLDELGNIMLGVGIALQVIGYLIIKKIVAIEV
jgi:tight adherence protein B